MVLHRKQPALLQRWHQLWQLQLGREVPLSRRRSTVAAATTGSVATPTTTDAADATAPAGNGSEPAATHLLRLVELGHVPDADHDRRSLPSRGAAHRSQ